MTATTDFVGVRVFSDLSDQVVSIDTRDSTVIFMVGPMPNLDPAFTSFYQLDTPVRISSDDVASVAGMGAGLMQDAVNQISAEGITTNIVLSRVAVAPTPASSAGIVADQLALVAGLPALRTGVYSALDAKSKTGFEPGIILAPGSTSQRLNNARNPVAAAIDSVCTTIIDCIGLVTCPAGLSAATAYAADFAHTLNIQAFYPNGIFELGGEVVRELAPSVAGAIVRNDKKNGNPYKAYWNQELIGCLGLDQPVSYRDGDPSCDANVLNQGGVGTVIEGNLLWAPFNTATDPKLVGYRSMKRYRTRRAIEKAMLRPLRAYLASDMDTHAVLLAGESLDQACKERKAIKAIIDYEVLFSRGLNPNDLLKKGGLRLKLRFEETPELVDLGTYSTPQPEAFDVLAEQIATAINGLGNTNFRAVA